MARGPLAVLASGARPLLLCCLAVAPLGLGVSVAPAADRPTTAVGVGAREYSLSLYRTQVRPGVVRFNLTNFGEDGHDLVVRTPAGRVAGRLPEIEGFGGRATLRVRLRRAGRYRLSCSIADHAKRGMKATLRVRR